MEIIKIIRRWFSCLNYHYYFKAVQARICYICIFTSRWHYFDDGNDKDICYYRFA